MLFDGVELLSLLLVIKPIDLGINMLWMMMIDLELQNSSVWLVDFVWSKGTKEIHWSGKKETQV